MRSESAAIADYFNAHKNLTTDAGAVLFGDTVTITADGPWQHLLYKLTGRKWGNLDVENETGCGIVPYTYKEKNLVNAVQWAVGLELLLLIDDPWRIYLTTDHPNGAAFWRYPEIIRLLMDREFRKEQLKRLAPKALKRIILPELDREYTLSDIAIITSAGPARALGLKQKGHLGIGADADVAIFNQDADVTRMFAYPRYVIKGGEVVLEEGEIRKVVEGRGFLVHPTYDEKIEDYIRPLFQQYYTMSFDNYPVEIERIEHPEIVATSAAHQHDHPDPQDRADRASGDRGDLPGRSCALEKRGDPGPAGLSRQTPAAAGRPLRGRGGRQRGDRNPRRCRPGQVDRPGHDPRPHQHHRRCGHAPRRVHEGRDHHRLG